MITGLPSTLLAALLVSAVASAIVCFLAWRRPDPVWMKVAMTLVACIPFVGPLFALWVASFPDKMHPNLQAKIPKVVNVYSSPHVRPAEPPFRVRWSDRLRARARRRGRKNREDNAR